MAEHHGPGLATASTCAIRVPDRVPHGTEVPLPVLATDRLRSPGAPARCVCNPALPVGVDGRGAEQLVRLARRLLNSDLARVVRVPHGVDLRQQFRRQQVHSHFPLIVALGTGEVTRDHRGQSRRTET